MMKGRPRAPFEELRSIGVKLNTDSTILERAADLVVAYLCAEPEWTPPTSVMAASALYMSTVMWGRPIAQKAAAEAIGVSASTVNRSYKRMAKVLFPYSGQCCQRKGRDDEHKRRRSMRPEE